MNQLKDPFGLEEVFEPVFPKITQARSLREGALDERSSALRDHHLPAVSGGRDSRGAMNV